MSRQFVKKCRCENLNFEHADFTCVDGMTEMTCVLFLEGHDAAWNYTVSVMLTVS